MLLALAVLGACGGGGGASGSIAGTGGDNGGAGPSTSPAPVSLAVLSSRADTVSDGSALVEVRLADEKDLPNLKVMAGSRDVTNSFARRSSGKILGVVSGMETGPVVIAASVGGQSDGATLSLQNYSRNGPIFSGPHQTPWICQTADFRLPDGSTLGPSTDTFCNAPTKVSYVYKPADGTDFKPLPSQTLLPADISQTKLSNGAVVNFIVRLETGTLNRAIYQIGILHDPTKDAPVSPYTAPAGWNGGLVYSFGGSAQAGYVQGLTTGDILTNPGIALGFAVASSTLNVFGNNANDVLSAETLTMVKAQFSKTYGLPAYTIGFGASGGAMQQHLIANNYPGLLDGLMPSYSWPDLFTVIPMVTDCTLLERAFQFGSEVWSYKEKTAVAGYSGWNVCNNGPSAVRASDWAHMFSPYWVNATRQGNYVLNCVSAIPDQYLYDPISNPGGARCEVYAASKNLLGLDPSKQVVQRPLDNVGLQYGLAAFQKGEISAEKFVQLNEFVGGYDEDGRLVSARTSASLSALRLAYEGGRIAQQQPGTTVPIIDFRVYTEADPELHDSIQSWKFRARLRKTNGTSDNQVIIRGKPLASSRVSELMAQMGIWLASISVDTGTYSTTLEKVIHNKPAALTNGCYTVDNVKIDEPPTALPTGQCNDLYPVHSTPRLVAGATLSDDILKCQLRPFVAEDYAQPLTSSQAARLKTVFPDGVCDFRVPGVGQAPLKSTWLAYPSPGGIAMTKP